MRQRKKFATRSFGAAFAGFCAALLFQYHHAVEEASAAPLKVTAAAVREAGEPTAQTVLVSVDATKTRPPDRAALEAVASLAKDGLPPLPESYAAARTLGMDSEWFRWGRLADAQAGITLGAQSGEPNPVAVYATTGVTGATALLVNASEKSVTVRVRIRLRRGSYEMQSLRFSPAKPAIAFAAQETSPAAPSVTTRLTYLDSCDFSAAHAAERQITLSPGEAALLRTNNVSRAAVGAYYTAYGLLENMRDFAPGPARRLLKMLRAGEPNLRSLTLSGQGGSGRRLAAIHHLLLVTAQVQSLERNYLARRAVKQATGAAAAAALETLSVALAQNSAVALDLVPQIEVSPNEKTGGFQVAISLRNGGAQSVDGVKLGLDAQSLPATSVCEPSDPAYFGVLPPGQSVEATFEVRFLSQESAVRVRCAADVSYRAAACPAHLRPRSRL